MRLASWIPARVRVALHAARRTLGAAAGAVGTLRGPVRRPGAAPAGRAPGLRAGVRRLQVTEVRRPTPDAVTLVLANSPTDPVRFGPGQYLTVEVPVPGAPVRRPYSLCSDPGQPEQLWVTVKRVPGGRASGWIHEHLAAGQWVQTVGPSGRFGVTPEPGARRRLILVAAGVGITPLFSVVQAITAQEPASEVELIYGNRREGDIIFREELARLADARPNLRVTHVLTRPPAGWTGPRGRIAGDVLAEVVPVDPQATYLVCGPRGMMDGVVGFLAGQGVPGEQVQTERFIPQGGAAAPATGAVHPVRFARSGLEIEVPDTRSILDAGLAAGVPLQFSCTMGGCAACKVRVLSGEVAMDEPNGLTPQERSRGERLLCIGRPTGPLVIDA